MSDHDPNVEAFKVHARVELRRLMQRYIDKENTPTLRASILEMVEAKLNDLVEEHFDVPEGGIHVEGSQDESELVVKLNLPYIEPFMIEECLRLAQAIEECDHSQGRIGRGGDFVCSGCGATKEERDADRMDG